MEKKIINRNYRNTEVIISGENASMTFNGRNGIRMTMNFRKESDGKTTVWMQLGTKRFQTVYFQTAWTVKKLLEDSEQRNVIESFLFNRLKYYSSNPSNLLNNGTENQD